MSAAEERIALETLRSFSPDGEVMKITTSSSEFSGDSSIFQWKPVKQVQWFKSFELN